MSGTLFVQIAPFGNVPLKCLRRNVPAKSVRGKKVIFTERPALRPGVAETSTILTLRTAFNTPPTNLPGFRPAGSTRGVPFSRPLESARQPLCKPGRFCNPFAVVQLSCKLTCVTSVGNFFISSLFIKKFIAIPEWHFTSNWFKIQIWVIGLNNSNQKLIRDQPAPGQA